VREGGRFGCEECEGENKKKVPWSGEEAGGLLIRKERSRKRDHDE
jgi:hypothetical protein